MNGKEQQRRHVLRIAEAIGKASSDGYRVTLNAEPSEKSVSAKAIDSDVWVTVTPREAG